MLPRPKITAWVVAGGFCGGGEVLDEGDFGEWDNVGEVLFTGLLFRGLV